MKIYTRTGDAGSTSLFGGQRVSKDHARLEAYGTIDELNAVLGLALSTAADNRTREVVLWLQGALFVVAADLATPFGDEDKSGRIRRVNSEAAGKAEQLIDELEAGLPELKNFILPGGTQAAASLHIARTVCRRAERQIIALEKTESINKEMIVFINRISDLLFVLARYENLNGGGAEQVVRSFEL